MYVFSFFFFFKSHAAAIMCPHAPFSYYFRTPRTQMIQQHTRDTKVLQFLRSSDPEPHCRARRPDRPRLIPRGNIVVCPCPMNNPGHHRITDCFLVSFPPSTYLLVSALSELIAFNLGTVLVLASAPRCGVHYGRCMSKKKLY